MANKNVNFNDNETDRTERVQATLSAHSDTVVNRPEDLENAAIVATTSGDDGLVDANQDLEEIDKNEGSEGKAVPIRLPATKFSMRDTSIRSQEAEGNPPVDPPRMEEMPRTAATMVAASDDEFFSVLQIPIPPADEEETENNDNNDDAQNRSNAGID